MDEPEQVWEEAEVPRREGHGHVIHVNGNAKLVSWILAGFGAVMTLLLSLVLTAVYNLNGDVHELRGQILAMSIEINAIKTNGHP